MTAVIYRFILRMKNFALLAVLMGSVGLALAACSPGSSQEPVSEKQPRVRPPSFFYRMEADFTLKETGEPIRFDYVVACGGVVETYSYTTPTVFYEHHPIMMYQAVGDGQALGLVSIDMCDSWKWDKIEFGPMAGQSRIPENLRPLAIWFDDVNDLSKGWGYKNDDAYESPLAKIVFQKASVTKTDEAAWQAWRDKAAAEYEQVGALPGPWGFSWNEGSPEATHKVMLRGAGYGIAGGPCLASFRVKVDQELIDRILEAAPPEVGQYWLLSDANKVVPSLIEEIYKRGALQDGTSYSDYRITKDFKLGTIGRAGDTHIIPAGSQNGLDYGFAWREIYPFLPRSDVMPGVTTPQDVYRQEIRLEDAYKGFGRCFSNGRPIDVLYTLWHPQRRSGSKDIAIFDAEGLSKRHELIIGDSVLRGNVIRQQPVPVLDRSGYFFATNY